MTTKTQNALIGTLAQAVRIARNEYQDATHALRVREQHATFWRRCFHGYISAYVRFIAGPNQNLIIDDEEEGDTVQVDTTRTEEEQTEIVLAAIKRLAAAPDGGSQEQQEAAVHLDTELRKLSKMLKLS